MPMSLDFSREAEHIASHRLVTAMALKIYSRIEMIDIRE